MNENRFHRMVHTQWISTANQQTILDTQHKQHDGALQVRMPVVVGRVENVILLLRGRAGPKP